MSVSAAVHQYFGVGAGRIIPPRPLSFFKGRNPKTEFNLIAILLIYKPKFKTIKYCNRHLPKQSSPKYNIMKKIQVPCYLRNGGKHQIVNVPLGIFTRLELKKLCEELLRRQKTLGTFVAAEATPRCLALLEGLTHILSLNLKPKAVRQKEQCWYAAYEKNLKQKQLQLQEDEVVNLVHAAISFGLIAIIFIIAAYLEYSELAQY